jgi:hypothetical protein
MCTAASDEGDADDADDEWLRDSVEKHVAIHEDVSKLRASSSLSSSTKAPANLSNLLIHQRFDGSFNAKDTALTVQLGITPAELETGALKIRSIVGPNVPESLLVEIWAAILVLSVLVKQYGSTKDVWELSADKTKQWIQTSLKSFTSTPAKTMITEMLALTA